ncbi:GntR family transcriptional regulator [Pullulanibacillus sp. KACC 23026]|uniref:GntR family transcriptional regulator n=1 Tax=Pullulanibacillus sp. KACC 23026 TaxID=3028315 RepID=UPI0023B0846E|nr:GntR family transcriptional regulator [Pullulanibacillus sp. KACC 23026]WEG15023.1 GntR family transcriptional regulator [Pullulanibacillus sp. KACC 23026]
MSTPNKRGKGLTRDFIYQTIKEQILSLTLKPGTKLSEKEVAAALEVSRTPVRESFLKLAQEELLEIYPQSGTIVSLIDLDHVEEDRFIRESIERSVIQLACYEFKEELKLETNLVMQELCLEKQEFSRLFELDEQFHKLLFEGSQKQRTWEFLHQSNSHLNRLRRLRVNSSMDWSVIVSQHKEIFQYIKEKEPQKAEEAMANHLRLALVEKEVLKERYPDFFK